MRGLIYPTRTTHAGDRRRWWRPGRRDVQLKDFPAEALAATEVAARQAADMAKPPSDLVGVLSRLERCGVPNFAEAAGVAVPVVKP